MPGHEISKTPSGSRLKASPACVDLVKRGRIELSRRIPPFCLAAVRFGDKWGFIDQEGTEVIPLQFSHVSDFENGYSLVNQGDKRFYIDSTGKPLKPIPPYDMVHPVKNGYSRVQKDGRWGFIDTNGRCTVRPQFKDALDFQDGIAPVWDDAGCKYIDGDGETVIPGPLPGVRRYGNFEEDLPLDRKTGFVIVSQKDRLGIRTLRGEWIIEPRFANILHFNEGLAPAAIIRGGRELWGYIDRSASFVIRPRYWDATRFRGGMACVREPDSPDSCLRFSLLNQNGGQINREYYFAKLTYLGEGIAIVTHCWNGFGPWTEERSIVYGPAGYIVPPFIDHDYTAWSKVDESPYLGNCWRVDTLRKSGDCGPYSLPGVSCWCPPSEGLINFCHRFHWKTAPKSGFMDLQGQMEIPALFSFAGPFSCGLAAVLWMGKFAYIDHSAQFVVKLGHFDYAGQFKVAISEQVGS